MKSLKNLINPIAIGCLALSTIGLLAPNISFADGKGASKLMFVSGAPTQAPSVASSPAHGACCKDAYVKTIDASAKGMRANSTKMVALHMCPACETKIASVGTGKTRVDNVIHTCGNSASKSSCCLAAK